MRLPMSAPAAVLPSALPAALSGSGVRASSIACVGASINGQGQPCVDTPFGSVCLPVSTPLPPGINAQACLDTCSRFGIPMGVCVDFSVNGSSIGKKCVGLC